LIDADQSLHILVEKDFECLHSQNDKNADAFRIPEAEILSEEKMEW